MSLTTNVATSSSSELGARPYRRARNIDVIVIGAGHAGLGMSFRLNKAGIEHVVLDAGDVGQRWRHERWDSLNLLTPNWTVDLPGKAYSGEAGSEFMPSEFMHKDVLADYLESYAGETSAPVKRHSRVHRVRALGSGYEVTTTQGVWHCRSVVLATGAYADPIVPNLAQYLPAEMQQLNSRSYKNAGLVEGQRVLVVGGSSTGLQFAQELNNAGKEVVLAAGEHVRMPRQVAGRDIYYWLDRSGVFWESTTEVDDLDRARKVPSPQLIGAHQELHLNTMAEQGIEIVGRLVGMNEDKLQFSGNLSNLCKSADLKMGRLLRRFQETCPELTDADIEFSPTELPKPRLGIKVEDFDTIVWATGFKPDYSYLDIDVWNRKGQLMHDEGVVAPGLYALGLPLMRTRASTFIAGAKHDSAALLPHLLHHIGADTPMDLAYA